VDQGSRPEDFLDEDLEEIDFLCRQRDFDAARQIGQRLLRMHPTNARVHEVMGDISAAEGEHTEAVDWYEMTLQLEPTERVRNKLLNERRRAGRSASGAGTQQDMARRRTWMIVAAAAVVLLLIVLIGFSMRGPSETEEPITAQAPTRSVAGRGADAGAPTSGGMAPSAPSTPRTRQPRAPRNYALPTEEPKANYNLPPVILTNEVDAPLTQQDRQLLGALASLNWPGGANLSGRVNVMTDPFNGYTFITVSVPRSAGKSDMFNTVVQMAYRMARTAAETDDSLRYFTVRFIIPVKVQREDRVLTLFRGNTNRQTLERYIGKGSQPGAREIWTRVFAEPWWNPSLPYDNPFG
jgi:hypothetical protein